MTAGARGTGLTRRALLAGAVALPLLACTAEPAPPPVDPDDALRAAAVTRVTALLTAYDAALAARPDEAPRLAPLRAAHAEHLALLEAEGSASPATSSAGPSPSAAAPPPVLDTAGLVAAERAASAASAADVPRASRALAQLLATIAAAEATHEVALVLT